jgi:hypothetical protein
MTDKHISIWFFTGILLFLYGLLIFGAGIYDLVHPPDHPPVLSSLHAGIWWGGLLAILGAAYLYVFAPGKRR